MLFAAAEVEFTGNNTSVATSAAFAVLDRASSPAESSPDAPLICSLDRLEADDSIALKEGNRETASQPPELFASSNSKDTCESRPSEQGFSR